MKNKPKFYIGLDVHKKFTTHVVRDIDGNILRQGECASKGSDLEAVLVPYLHSCIMGAETNIEVYPVYEYFISKSIDIRIANTIQLRTLISKNDKLDAIRLSDMLRLGTFPRSFIPDGNIKELRNIVEIRHCMLNESRRIQLKIKSITRKHGLDMPSCSSFGKKWCEAISYYLAIGKGGFGLRHSFEMYLFVSNRLEQVTNEMIAFAMTNFPNEYDAIIKRKGIGPTLTSYFISEICPITRFNSAKKLRRYAGVIPCSLQTGGKTYSTFLPKTASRGKLRWAMIEAAHCMLKFDDNMKAYYRKKKKEKKISGKAMMSVASSISDILYKTLVSCQHAS